MGEKYTGEEQGMEFMLSEEQEQHLRKIGYSEREMEVFKTSAQNEYDVELLKNIALGDYENAFSVSPNALSEVCKM